MGTVVSRSFCSVPVRTASETWEAITSLLAPDRDSSARHELGVVSGIAAMLITQQSMTEPIIVTGENPRVRVYCLYDEDATVGDKAREGPLSFVATEGDWHLSLPCPKEDLSWVRSALASKGSRVSARDMNLGITLNEEDRSADDEIRVEFDSGAFLSK